MKGYFPRNTLIATGLTVAWSLVSHPVLAQGGLEIAYQQGYDDGSKACQNQCNNEKSGLLSPEQCNSQYSGYITQGVCESQKSGLLSPEQCNSQYSGYITQGICDSQKSGLLSQGQCDTNYSGYITQGVCDSQKSGLLTQGQCDSQKSGLITQGDCNNQYKDQTAKSTCDSEKKTISDQLSTCNTEKGNLSSQLSGLITQDVCKAQYKDYITTDKCPVSSEAICKSTYTTTLFTQTEIAQYTGYVDTTTPATPIAKSCKDDPSNAACTAGTLKGFKEGYEEGKTAGSATATATEVAKYTGYVDTTTTPATPIAKSCKDDPSNAACTTGTLKGFKEGYEEGKTADSTATTATEVAKYTGYVDTTTSATPTAKSCEETPTSVDCTGTSKKKGFKEGYAEGQLSLAGYTTKENGKTVPKPCKLPSDDSTCQPGNLQGFIKGYELGEKTTTEEKPMTVTECQKNPDTCTNQDFKAGRDTGKAEATAQYTGYVDADGAAQSCKGSTPDSKKCANSQGFTEGYQARGTFCKNNPQLCIMTYLQGFYDYFVKQRLQNVKESEKSFPQDLTVSPAGGPTPTELADQWRYTWVLKQKGCGQLNSGERFKPLKDDNQELSICLEQAEDMGTVKDSTQPNFGSSKNENKLESNQSLGYTVYLMDGEKVVTMEIIFSPDSKDSASASGTTGTATNGSTTSTATGGSTTSDTVKTNP